MAHKQIVGFRRKPHNVEFDQSLLKYQEGVCGGNGKSHQVAKEIKRSNQNGGISFMKFTCCLNIVSNLTKPEMDPNLIA